MTADCRSKLGAELTMKGALALDAAFWVENGDQLSQRFNAWAAK